MRYEFRAGVVRRHPAAASGFRRTLTVTSMPARPAGEVIVHIFAPFLGEIVHYEGWVETE